MTNENDMEQVNSLMQQFNDRSHEGVHSMYIEEQSTKPIKVPLECEMGLNPEELALLEAAE